jgi:hypothetical protein
VILRRGAWQQSCETGCSPPTRPGLGGMDDAAAALALATPASFARYAYQLPPHLRLIDDQLLEAAAGRKRLCVSTAPRHGKSMLAGIYYCTWMLLRFPTKRIIY